jgi:DNA-directed RNA polymerase specialized sigma24 family protein
MAGTRRTPADPVEEKLDEIARLLAPLDEIARLLALLIARDRSLQDAVTDLSRVGFKPTRIADLLGTSPGYAKVAVDRAKKRKSKERG